jgi:hypothetical protein
MNAINTPHHRFPFPGSGAAAGAPRLPRIFDPGKAQLLLAPLSELVTGDGFAVVFWGVGSTVCATVLAVILFGVIFGAATVIGDLLLRRRLANLARRFPERERNILMLTEQLIPRSRG